MTCTPTSNPIKENVPGDEDQAANSTHRGVSIRGLRAGGIRFLAGVLFISALPFTRTSLAQRLGKLDALGRQQALIDAIAKAEKSVVAIARVRRPKTTVPSLGQADSRRQAPAQQPSPEAPPAEDPADRANPDQSIARRAAVFKGPEEMGDPLDTDFTPHAFGAGVIVDASGYIVTNYHVLGDISQNDYFVWTQGRPFRAKATVKAADPWMDLAVIKIEGQSLTPIVFGAATHLKKGQLVIALGNPYAIARDGQASASLGIISNLSRRAPAGRGEEKDVDRTLHHYGTLIHTDAALHIGSSGGALINLKGEMIGLTSSLAALAGYEKSGGFAIPTDDHFQRVLKKLRTGHRAQYGFLGIRPDHLDPEDRRNGRTGALVADVVAATPAAAAGVEVRDVITHVNDEPVIDANQFTRNVSRLPAAAEVVFTLERAGLGSRRRVLKKKTILGKKHIDHTRPTYSKHPPVRWRGMLVDYATAAPRFHELSHLADPAGSVVVVDVAQDSPGWQARLRAPAFVSHVEGQRVATPDEFYAAVNKLGGDVSLTVSQAGRRKFQLTVKP